MITFELTIEARERDFREVVMTKNHEILMEENTLLNFLDHWTQETTYKKQQVMLWEKREDESAFAVGNPYCLLTLYLSSEDPSAWYYFAMPAGVCHTVSTGWAAFPSSGQRRPQVFPCHITKASMFVF